MGEIILLNVGGILYTTTRSTLSQVQDTMLSSLINKNTTIIDGRLFIDRNGNLFSYILDFFRDTTKWNPPRERGVCEDLLREAEYYSISPLIEKLKERLTHLTTTFTVIISWDERKKEYKADISYEAPNEMKTVGPYNNSLIRVAKQLGYRVICATESEDREILSFEGE